MDAWRACASCVVRERQAMGALDVTVLSDHVLEPILGITDLRRDKRIDFVGGIRGLGELERRALGAVAGSRC